MYELPPICAVGYVLATCGREPRTVEVIPPWFSANINKAVVKTTNQIDQMKSSVAQAKNHFVQLCDGRNINAG